MKNPDYTFWTRLIGFAENVEVNDAISFDEKNYILYVARQQLLQQKDNAKGEELEYLKRVHPGLFQPQEKGHYYDEKNKKID